MLLGPGFLIPPFLTSLPRRFRVLNLRQDFKFVLLRGGLQFPRVAAESAPIKNLAPNEPTQGHFSLTGRPGCVAVAERG